MEPSPLSKSKNPEYFTQSKRKTIDHILFHTKSMTEMAKKLMSCGGASNFMTLGNIVWDR